MSTTGLARVEAYLTIISDNARHEICEVSDGDIRTNSNIYVCITYTCFSLTKLCMRCVLKEMQTRIHHVVDTHKLAARFSRSPQRHGIRRNTVLS